MTSWEIGRKLDNGKYVVEKELGRGAFGITYKVRASHTDRLFAVKTLNESLQQRSDFQAIQVKFINEAIKLAKCSHPNIADVTEVFMEDQLWCMVMEYIDGQELADYLRQKGTLPETEAINIINQVGSALSCVHEKDILHRDIKPENILLRKSDLSPVLVDFGLAREFIPNQTRQALTHRGTPFYAPIEEEDLEGQYGAWTDIYALAATLYILVIGNEKTPGLHSLRRKIVYLQNKQDPLPKPQKLNSKLSDRINKAILKGMEIEPSERPQSIEEWLKLFKSKLITLKDIQDNPTIFLMGTWASGKSCFCAALAYYLKNLEYKGIIEIEPILLPSMDSLNRKIEILKGGMTPQISSKLEEYGFYIRASRNNFLSSFKKPAYFKNDISFRISDIPASLFETLFYSEESSKIFDKISHRLNYNGLSDEFSNENYYIDILEDEFIYTNRVALMVNSSTSHRDLQYFKAITNLYMGLEKIFSTDLKTSYRIAVIFSSFDLPGIYKYRHRLNDFIRLNFSQTNQALNQWKNKWNCSLEYFCCSSYGTIKNSNISNSNWKTKLPKYHEYHDKSDYAYSELAEPENWEPFGLLEPIVWLLNR